MIKTILTAVIFIFMVSAFASDNSSFNKEITALYNFAPHTLSRKEVEEKSKLLDMFWKKITNNPDKYKHLLRNELSINNHVPYFFYDASKLLLTISNEKEDKILALKAIQKTDLKSIQNTDYLLTVTRLSIEGFDTSDAAFHILSAPDFKAFIVQHALTLGQDYSLVSMLMPINQDLYINKALIRIKNETDDIALSSLLKLLWYSDTPEAVKAIASISTDNKYSAGIIKLAKNLANESNLKKSVPEEKLNKLYKSLEVNTDVTYDELKTIRRKRFNRVSDEALIELEQITILMKRKRVLKI